MKKIPKKLFAVNFLGTVGYLFTLFSWLLFLGVVLLLVWQNSSIDVSRQTVEPGTGGVGADPSVLLTGIGYGVTALMVLVSFIVLIVLPYFIGKLGGRILRTLMKLFKMEVSRRHLFFMQCGAATLPLLGFFVIALVASPADMTVPAAHIATIISSILAMVCFLAELLLARRLKVTVQNVW